MKNMQFAINKNGNVVVNEENVMKIMHMIVLNQISNVREYVSKNIKMNTSDYYSKVKEIEKKYPKFYKYYITNLENNKNIMKEKIKNILFYIGDSMNRGIKIDDKSIREFDLLDLYYVISNYFDNLNRTEISNIVDEFMKDNMLLGSKINIFELRKNLSIVLGNNPGSYSREMLKEEVYKLNELEPKEIERLLIFMEENNIPLNERNYIIGRDKLLLERINGNDLFKLELSLENEIKRGTR